MSQPFSGSGIGYGAKPLDFNGASFVDLFKVYRPWVHAQDTRLTVKRSLPKPGQRIGLYCHSTHNGPHRALYVEPGEKLEQYMREQMLTDFGFHVSICIRDNGEALITMSYDQIIGSLWLCVVPADSIPWGDQ